MATTAQDSGHLSGNAKQSLNDLIQPVTTWVVDLVQAASRLHCDWRASWIRTHQQPSERSSCGLRVGILITTLKCGY